MNRNSYVVKELEGRSPDEQLFLLLQSMGYAPPIPLWQYQQAHKRIGMCPWCGQSLHPGRKCENDGITATHGT